MPTLLVTGGCGFIGSNFVRHLLVTDPAVKVINFDALTSQPNRQDPAGDDEPGGLRSARPLPPASGSGPGDEPEQRERAS